MIKKNQKEPVESTRKKKILKKIESLIVDGKNIITPGDNLLWIRRIIVFIDNEFPRKKKYQNIENIFEKMIKNGDYKYPSLRNFHRNTIRILEDLASTYDLDAESEFHINLHNEVKEHSLELFENGHYSQAVFEAVKALNNYVKEKAGMTNRDLSDAMTRIFNENNPIIKLNELKTQSDKDEQEGFRFLYMGAMKGIRNPKAHENIKQKDKNRTLEYLAFLSLLFHRAEEGKL